MKKWKVTYTLDKESFKTEEVEGKTYTDAYVNMMLRCADAEIVDVREV